MKNVLVRIALLVMLSLSLVGTTAVAAPGWGGDEGPLLGTKAAKEAKKQAAHQKKAEAVAEKKWRKCMARGDWRCIPTVTAYWASIPTYPDLCQFGVSVTGFAPGQKIEVEIWVVAPNPFIDGGYTITVGPDGTGTGQGELMAKDVSLSSWVVVNGERHDMPVPVMCA